MKDVAYNKSVACNMSHRLNKTYMYLRHNDCMIRISCIMCSRVITPSGKNRLKQGKYMINENYRIGLTESVSIQNCITAILQFSKLLTNVKKK